MARNNTKERYILDPVRRPWGLYRNLKDRVISDSQAMLNAMERIDGINNDSYYLIDYYDERLLFLSEDSILLCGYSSEQAKRDGLLFYNRIMEREDWEWMFAMNEAAYKLFYDTPIRQRLDFSINYNMRLVHRSGAHFTIKHELAPLNLCKKGNMWIGLCKVSYSNKKYCKEAYVVDRVVGKRYDFIDGEFKRSKEHVILSKDELTILKLSADEVPTEEIAALFGINAKTLISRRTYIYRKLEATSLAGAMQRAKKLELL